VETNTVGTGKGNPTGRFGKIYIYETAISETGRRKRQERKSKGRIIWAQKIAKLQWLFFIFLKTIPPLNSFPFTSSYSRFANISR
jgi:hypothetical protein